MFIRRVRGRSMLPTLAPRQLLLAVRPRQLTVGDVVVFRHEGLEKVKRIQQLRADEMFVVGDQPAYSTDSRSFGWLKQSCVIGRVCWPDTVHSRYNTE